MTGLPCGVRQFSHDWRYNVRNNDGSLGIAEAILSGRRTSMSKLKLWLVIAAVPVVIMAFALRSLLPDGNGCSFYPMDSLPSPSKGLSLARVEKRCSSDIETPSLSFALLPPGAAVRVKDIFLTARVYEATTGDVSVWEPRVVFGKWVSEKAVIIAAPEGSGIDTSRSEFNGVHIDYASYPIEASGTKDEHMTHVVEKKFVFEGKFKTDEKYPMPGAGCELTISGRDGEYVDLLSWSLRARITYAYDSHPAFSSYDFLVLARDEIEKPDKHAIIANAIGFSPKEGKSTLWAYDLNYPGIKAPSGVPTPKWQFGYIPKNPRDLIAMAESARNGTFALEVNYWLDDEIVRYSAVGPIDPRQINAFEHCIAENRILDAPQLSKGR
jgi:hypothetical protein